MHKHVAIITSYYAIDVFFTPPYFFLSHITEENH